MKKVLSLLIALSMALASLSFTAPAAVAANVPTLTVDMTAKTGPMRHGSAGFLYGLGSHGTPNANTLTPLKPGTAVQKAPDGMQHPTGDVLDVAETFLEAGGEQVQVYLQDIYALWNYEYTGMDDYLSRIREMIPKLVDLRNSRPEFAGKIVYVPFNEPDGIWYVNINSNASVQNEFNSNWKAAYELIKSLDPDALIGGVSFASYQANAMESWIRFCTQNNCEPDYITWHELQTDKLSSFKSHLDHYRGLEQKYGMTEREIIINEYAPQDHCSNPGKLVNWIALFEENKASGCLPYWHNAGNLNDIAADNNEPNGAWWLYKWYGDMSGETLKLTTSTARDQLYGLASIDDNKKSANVIFGGVDGTAAVVLNNIADTEAFKGAEAVDIKVEATYWTAFHGVAAEPTVIRTGTYAVENGTVTVEIDGMEANAAYNITVTAATDPAAAGVVYRGPWRGTWEAENAALSGGAATTDYRWTYAKSGSLRVTGIVNPADGVKFTVDVPQSGYYRADLVYGNGYGADTVNWKNNATATVTQTRTVDGASEIIYLENTLRAEMSGVYTEYIKLDKGTHSISYFGSGKTSVGADLDCLTLTYCGGSVPEFDSVYEAELGDFNTLLGNKNTTVSTESDIPGYSASGYITGLDEVSVKGGGGVRFTVVVPDNGLYNLTLRYSADAGSSANIYLDNTALTLTNLLTNVELPASESFVDASVTAFLQKGINIIDIDTTDAAAFDYLRVSKASGVDGETVIVEAEDADLIGAEIADNAFASGSYVSGIEGGTDDSLEFTLSVPEDGEYKMVMRYSNGELFGSHDYNAQLVDRYASYSVNDGEPVRVYFKNTYSIDNWRTVAVPVTLKAGENTVKVYNDNWRTIQCGVLKAGTTAHLPENIVYHTLVNFAPELDSFSFTPAVLGAAAKVEERYKVSVMATRGGYVSLDRSTVPAGENVTLTLEPDFLGGKLIVTANGEDVSDLVEDGQLTMEVTGNIEFRVIFGEAENSDLYIVNNSFGTGDLTGWTVQGDVSIETDGDRHYAVIRGKDVKTIRDQSAIGQYFFGEGSGYYTIEFGAAGTGKVGLEGLTNEDESVAIDIDSDDWQTYSVNVTCSREDGYMLIGAIVENDGDVLMVDNFRVVNFAPVDTDLLYFVDSGDPDVTTLSEGDMLGIYNSVTEQFYGEDPVTGMHWGIDDVYVKSDKYPSLLTGRDTWPCENNSAVSDGVSKVMTFRYAKDQNDRTGPGVTYKFELPDESAYTFEVGFYCNWGSSPNRKSSLRVNGKVIASGIIPSTSVTSPVVIRGNANVLDGEATLNLKLDSDGSGGPMISYIKISKAPGTLLDTTGMKTSDTGTWENNNHAENAYDGNVNSFFDGNQKGEARIDFGEEKTLSGIGFIPRNSWAGRMVNTSFYGSNDGGKTWTEIYKITSQPPYGVETYIPAEDFLTEERSFSSFKYMSSSDYCNVAEIYLYEYVPVPEYAVEYNMNGGEGTVPEEYLKPVPEGSTIALWAPEGEKVPVREKAVFLGWSTAAHDIYTWIPEEGATVNRVVSAEGVKVYAVWAVDENGNKIPDYCEYAINKVEVDGATAKVTLYGTGDAVLIGALYSPDGTLAEVKSAQVKELPAKSELIFSREIEGYELRIFMWDTVSGLTPLTKAYTSENK